MSERKSGDWSYCPACGGPIDVGYECNKCGRDWLEWHDTREALFQKYENKIDRINLENAHANQQTRNTLTEGLQMRDAKLSQQRKDIETLLQNGNKLRFAYIKKDRDKAERQWDEYLLTRNTQ